MVKDESRIPSQIRDISPCYQCTERFTACHDHCPKDERGAFGYKAWLKKAEQVKDAKKAYDRSKPRKKKYWRKYNAE